MRRAREPIAQEHEECPVCLDLGVIKIVEHGGPDTNLLMLCACEEGINQTYDLPRWHREFNKLYAKGPCPLEWFKGEDAEFTSRYIWAKAREWKTRIKAAEQQWHKLAEEALEAASEVENYGN